MKALIKELKEQDQDYEFYPTTPEIIEKVVSDIKKPYQYEGRHYYANNNSLSLLDIGAGNGIFLKRAEELLKHAAIPLQGYGIEKSTVLIDQLIAKDCIVLGTEFNEQTLIDKKMDVIFCNPPYSEYISWTSKIIKEANAKRVYLVIPERWQSNEEIGHVIELRKAKVTILGQYDFLESPDRKARAKVHLLRVEFTKGYNLEVDPFDVWFEETFPTNASEEVSDYEKEKEQKEKIKNSLIKGENLIFRLVELYQKDMENLINNYRKISTLDSSLLKEFNIDIAMLKKGLSVKIQGLKNLYWTMLFDNLDKITERLIKKMRTKMLDSLTKHTFLDFTTDNIYTVVKWVLKNANLYFDEQLKEMYLYISNEKNVRNYKSNKRQVTGDWRFNREKPTHYTLDYRIVHSFYQFFEMSYSNKITGIARSAKETIEDVLTIGKNLGFNVKESVTDFDWAPGKKNLFHYDDKVFVKVKGYKNGNIHFTFCQDFMKKFNIEAARLLGWVHSPKDVMDEFVYSDKKEKKLLRVEADKMFKSNLNIDINTASKFLTT